MTVYILILTYLLLCSIFCRRNKLLFILTGFLLLFVAGFRDISVGTDTQNYFEIYEYIRYDNEPVWFSIEPGWRLLNYIAILLNTDYFFIILLASIFTIVPIFSTIWKYSNKPFISVLFFYLLFFYFQSFNAIRQMIAVAFIFSAYNDYLNKNKKWSYFKFCIASLFHYSALLCLVFPFIFKYVRINTSKACVILPVTYILGIYFIPSLIPHLPLVGKYSVYLLHDIDASFSIPRLLINLLCVFFIITSYRNNNQLKLFYAGIICYNLFAFSEVAGRCALYFMSSQMILFANLICVHTTNKRILNMATTSYGLVYLFVLLLNNNGEILPYSNHLF